MGTARPDENRTKRRRFLEILPGGWRLLPIIWPFLVIVAVLLWLSSESMSILVAARSYSEGESLWSKGQKESVFHLLRYAETRDDANYQKYLAAISVPLGDRKARVELEKPNPDYAMVWQGLIEGRTHPDDIPHVIKLYRRFRNVSFMAEVIATWTAGDGLIEELTLAADHLHRRISAGDPAKIVRPILDNILDIDGRLTPLEDRFTKRLGDAARITQFLLLIASFAAAAILIPIGIFLSHRMTRRRLEAEQALKLSEERFKLAVTGSSDGLCDWNVVTGEMYFSPRFEQLLGFGELELDNLMDTFLARVHPEDRAATDQAFHSHLEQGAPFDIEMHA